MTSENTALPENNSPQYIPAPNRTGCGTKFDRAALASLIRQSLSHHHLFLLNNDFDRYAFRPINSSAEKIPLLRPQDRSPNIKLPDTRTKLTAPHTHIQGDHLSPQYLHPPNPSAILSDTSGRDHSTDQTLFKTIGFRVHVHGDHLSPQYLHPPNLTRTFKTNIIKTPQRRATFLQQKLSPQYLHPPGDPQTETKDLLFPQHVYQLNPSNGINFERERTAVVKLEQDLNLGKQNLSPQYLFPPNIRNSFLTPEPIIEKPLGRRSPPKQTKKIENR